MQQPNKPADFTFNRVGTTGYEIRDGDGSVVAWTVDESWAAVIVSMLNKAHIGLGRVLPDT